MKLSDTEKEEIRKSYYKANNIVELTDFGEERFQWFISKFDDILEKKEKDIQMSADGKYISYQGKIYVYEDEKFKELNNK
jgi:hypothetical protein